MRVLCLVAALLLVHAAFCQAESRTSIQFELDESFRFVEPSVINIQTAQAYARERGKSLRSTKVSFDSRFKSGAGGFTIVEAFGGAAQAGDEPRSTESAFRALAGNPGPCEDEEKSAECLLEYKGSAGATLAHGGKQKLNVKLKGNVPAGTLAEAIEALASSFDANRVPTTDNVWESLL